MVKKNVQVLVGILILLIILEGGYSAFKFSLSTFGGYVTGYEGAKARFAGVQYGGEDYSAGFTFDTGLNFDPDGVGQGVPAISGEMTAVFIPSESVGKQTKIFASGADISDWLLEATSIKNPIEVYEWEIPTEGNESRFYRMEEWTLKWYFSLSSEPVGDEAPKAYINEGARNAILDAKIWFEFDIAPVWYFEGADTAYFAIAELRISDIQLGGKLQDTSYEVKKNNELRVTPMSKGSILPIYYGLFGSEANRADKTVYSYKGKVLNPNLFTDKVYSYFTLNSFGVTSWWDWGTKWRADVVTVGVDVHIFVIGEWKVKDVQDLPDEYGREAKEGGGGLGLNEMFLQMLNDPAGRLLLALIGIVAVFLIIAIVAPQILIAILALIGMSRRKGG